MGDIKERNIQIFKLRYEEGLTSLEIGKIFGISGQRIRQIAPGTFRNSKRARTENAKRILLLQECVKSSLSIKQAMKKTGFGWEKIKKLIPDYIFQSRLNKFRNQIQEGGSDECWNWLGCKGENGYGIFGFSALMGDYKNRYAHRIAWFLHNNQLIKEGMQILHTCDNPLCCNPNHLYVGTPLDNMKDRDRRGRWHNRRLFTEQAVIEMRKRHSNGESIALIRRNSYPNISYTVVFNAIRGRTYKNIASNQIATSA